MKNITKELNANFDDDGIGQRITFPILSMEMDINQTLMSYRNIMFPRFGEIRIGYSKKQGQWVCHTSMHIEVEGE